ncbi:hypothetical protein KGP36_01825 [Patescibacteria group bacterium]|nr:hypothetical protein [Patescibacteria group bacterium]
MKIEIDLDELFQSEGETTEEAIRKSIIAHLSKEIRVDTKAQIKATIPDIITGSVKEYMANLLPNLIEEEFSPKTEWGEKLPKTSVRHQIIEGIKAQLKFTPNARWDSDKSVITKLVEDATKKIFEEFQQTLAKEINAQFTARALEEAKKQLAGKLGIKQ